MNTIDDHNSARITSQHHPYQCSYGRNLVRLCQLHDGGDLRVGQHGAIRGVVRVVHGFVLVAEGLNHLRGPRNLMKKVIKSN